MAGAAIAGNLKVPVVDVRDAAPEEVRSFLYLAVTVLYIPVTVLYLAVTVLYMPVTVVYLAVTVLYVTCSLGRYGRG